MHQKRTSLFTLNVACSVSTVVLHFGSQRTYFRLYIHTGNTTSVTHTFLQGRKDLSMLDEILANNERFLRNTTLPHIGHAPRKHTAIVTCMDCRLVNMFEDALGLERGDVLELRTAGATISAPDRAGANNDLIRSLAAGIYLLGVRRVIVVGHTECGLSRVNPTVLTASMQALGVD